MVQVVMKDETLWYALFNPTQRIDSDLDKHLRGLFDD